MCTLLSSLDRRLKIAKASAEASSDEVELKISSIMIRLVSPRFSKMWEK
jgi:hypothetical protein